MRAPLSPLLLATAWVTTAWLAGAGCASAPKETPVASKERTCANDSSDPLHMVSSRPDVGRDRDPQIEAILNQQPADPRLAWVNRQMYQTLHALDVELHREQRIAACEHPELSSPTLEAQSGSGGSVGGGAGAGDVRSTGGGAGASNGAASVAVSPDPGGATPPANTGSIGATSATPSVARSTLIRKASLSASGGGGNGATAPKITPGSDNDIVARRLRKAAEQETNPTLRAKLWKEYADYRQGLAAK